jgi:hypothetical protein
MSAARPDRRYRILAAALAAAIIGGYTLRSSLHEPPGAASDFDQIWVAARALFAGEDPYAAVVAAGWRWPLYYPLPAVLVGIPFAALPRIVARSVFAGIGAGAFAYVMSRRGWWGLLALLSASYLYSMFHVQWTPLLIAAMLIPWLSGLLVVKPSIGLAYAFAHPSWRTAAGAALLVAMSLVVLPEWPRLWLAAIQDAAHLRPPVLRPGGVLLLLGLLRWRLPEGRLLAGLACVPHQTLIYETLPLMIIPRSFRQMGCFVLLTQLANTLVVRLVPIELPDPERVAAQWPFMLSLLYLPALLLVLRRPNEPSG